MKQTRVWYSCDSPIYGRAIGWPWLQTKAELRHATLHFCNNHCHDSYEGNTKGAYICENWPKRNVVPSNRPVFMRRNRAN